MLIFSPKIAFRNLLRHKSTTFISLAGFVVGLLSVIFLYFYIENEVNYDAFHVDKNEIYRVKRIGSINGGNYDIGVTSAPFAEGLLNDYPVAIKSVLRAYPEECLVTIEDRQFQEDDVIFADSNFFEFFSYPLSYGNPETVLDEVNSVVISSEIARKYYGDSNPIGQTLIIENEYSFIVTGILDKFPNKSHLSFDMVFSIAIFNSEDWFHGWWNNGLITYAKVDSQQEAEHLNDLLPQFMDKYFGEDFKQSGNKIGLALEPLSALYFNKDTRYDKVNHGNKNNIIILAFVAIAILFIACFNYINLSIAQSYKRAKEVGIRKVLGAHRSRLVLQFLGESILIMLFSSALSILFSEVLLAKFNDYFGLKVIFNWFNSLVVYFFISLFLVTILTSGLYPALLLSSFKPIRVLKGGTVSLGKNLIVRKGLVIAQFSISIFLIIATILITAQINFMKSKSLGYDQNSILIINNNNGEIREKREVFKEAIKELPNVTLVGSSSGAPGGYHDGTTLQIAGIDHNIKVRTVFADTEYLKIFNIPVVAGRGFDSELSSEMGYAMMINEKALSDLGVTAENVIGKKTKVPGWDMERTIVGVYKDYHFLDLKNQIEPQAIMMGDFHRRYIIKMGNHNISETVHEIESLFKSLSPNYPMSYWFQDEQLARHYIEEEKQAKVFIWFALVSIFLACLGIFGLASYSAQQRQKELSIRKVLGASIQQIIGLISKEFMILVALSSVVSTPLCWLFMNHWLADFAYRINLGSNWMVFIIGGIIAFLVAFITISLKAFKTALANPVESLRNE